MFGGCFEIETQSTSKSMQIKSTSFQQYKHCFPNTKCWRHRKRTTQTKLHSKTIEIPVPDRIHLFPLTPKLILSFLEDFLVVFINITRKISSRLQVIQLDQVKQDVHGCETGSTFEWTWSTDVSINMLQISSNVIPNILYFKDLSTSHNKHRIASRKETLEALLVRNTLNEETEGRRYKTCLLFRNSSKTDTTISF